MLGGTTNIPVLYTTVKEAVKNKEIYIYIYIYIHTLFP